MELRELSTITTEGREGALVTSACSPSLGKSEMFLVEMIVDFIRESTGLRLATDVINVSN